MELRSHNSLSQNSQAQHGVPMQTLSAYQHWPCAIPSWNIAARCASDPITRILSQNCITPCTWYQDACNQLRFPPYQFWPTQLLKSMSQSSHWEHGLQNIRSPWLACTNWCIWAPCQTACIWCPICSDMTPVDTSEQWRCKQPAFHLSRRSWSLLNCFWTCQECCLANLHKQGLAKSDFWACIQW